MRHQVSWWLALTALVMGGSLVTGCKSHKSGRKPVDSGIQDGGSDGGQDGGDGGDGGPVSAGFVVNPTSGLQTAESGGLEAKFKVSLAMRPSGDVTIALSSSDPSEGTINLTQLVFTPANWAAEQEVIVRGVNDDDADGPVDYTIVLAAAQSSDPRYAGVDPPDVGVSNADDDSAGVLLQNATNLMTSEPNIPTSFQVRLTTRPTASVSIGLTSSDAGEVAVSPASVTFTIDNWNAPQTVTLTGVDDTEVDGPVTVTIVTAATSTDARYNGITVADVMVINSDNDTPGFVIVPTTGLRTSERGAQDSFVVALNARPTANVTIPVSSLDEGEVTVSVSSLTFTPDDWNSLHTVLVTGQDDAEEDGSQPFSIALGAATSQDARFQGRDPQDVSGNNIDDETAGVTVIADESLTATEGGAQATFRIVLNSRPTADVVIPVTSSATDQATVAPASLRFTRDNWNGEQLVTISAVDDAVADGPQPVTIDLGAATSDDADYQNSDPGNVTVTIVDNDSPGITVLAEDLVTTESGGQASLVVVLNSQPSGSVTIPVSSGDTQEITLSAASLTFTVDNWNSPQTVLLTGVDDELADGEQAVQITIAAATSADTGYNGMLPSPSVFLASNVDNDTPGASLTPNADLVTTEGGTQASFTFVLNSLPTADVTFSVAVSDATEASVSVATLSFTPVNWNAPQTLTLTGLDDVDADGHQPYFVVFGPAVSDDPGYSGLVVENVTASNRDNDTPGFSVLDAAALSTSETGTQATFRVVLDSRPSADVTIAVASSAATEGTVAPDSLVFTPLNWNAPQAITVTGVDEEIADGNRVYFVELTPDSSDTLYDTLPIPNVPVTNVDDDEAGITVDAAVPLIATEAGTQATFTVTLNSQPTAPVSIAIGSSDPSEANVSPNSLTFTALNWNALQTVTVTGAGDLLQDGNQPFSVLFGAATSDDANYAGRALANLAGTNIDNDSPNITVIAGPLNTTEGGGQASFTVALGAQPTSDVVLPLASGNTAEGTISPASLTFTPADWSALRVVTLTGIDDAVQDGDQPYQVQIGPAESLDPGYAGRTIPVLTATNGDDDIAGINIVAVEPLLTDEVGGTASFTVTLNSQPTANVTIPLALSDDSEASLSTASLTFTTLNWAGVQVVTLTGLNDDVADGVQPYSVLVGPAVSGDPNYGGRNVPNVTATNTDDDTPGLVVVAPVPLATSEAGATDTFVVRLQSQPTADVTVTIGTTIPGEGRPDNPTLIFTAANWSVNQVVTIRGVDDAIDDLAQPYQITITADSTDPNYVRTVPNLDALNADNDTAAIVVAGVPPFPGSLATSEPTVSTTFTIVLNSQPIGDVTVPLGVDDASEISVSPPALVFSSANWNTPQTVTVSGVDDAVVDGPIPAFVTIGTTISVDANYGGQNLPNVSVLNSDDDGAGLVLSKNRVSTFEQGIADSFAVTLRSEPTADVTITIASSDTTEATVSPALLTFTAANWNVAQAVTATGINDLPVPVDDGDIPYTIQLTAAGAGEYAVLPAVLVDGTNGEAFYLNCQEVKDLLPAEPSGVFYLDTDGNSGPNPKFRAYCDQDTDGGGWTLLSWTADSETLDGPPYPGLAYCNDVNFNCARGTGVPGAALSGLFAASTELAQGQGITITGTKPTFDDLGTYEFAGSFVYPSLAGLTAPSGACAGLVQGTYNNLSGTPTFDGVAVFLNQSLAAGDPALSDYSSDANAYLWSIGNRTGHCLTNGTQPASFLGTWQAGQYGPGHPTSAGSYSIWVR